MFDKQTIGASRLYHFPGTIFHEAVPGAEPVLGGGAEPPAEPVAEADELELGAEEQAAVVAPQPLSADDLSELIRNGAGEAFEDMLARAEQQERERVAASRPMPELPAWDPYNPEVVQAYFWRSVAPQLQRLEQMIAPANDLVQRNELQEGETAAKDILGGFAKDIGEFDRDVAIRSAAFYVTRHGMDPEAALEQAAREERDRTEQIENAAIERFRSNAQNLADAAPAVPGSGAATETPPVIRGKKAYEQAARATLARMGQGPGLGVPSG